jgi:macrolide-specific efflux system membrane fusion protein
MSTATGKPTGRPTGQASGQPPATAYRPARRRRRGWTVTAVVAALAVAGAVAAYLVTTRSGTTVAAQPLATAVARRGTLTQTVDASFTLIRDPSVTLTSPQSGLITGLYLRNGAKPASFKPLFAVNGTKLYAIVSATPIYRSLASGDTGDDVKALQEALKAAGYDPGAADGDFGAGTVAAIEQWQTDQGLTVDGKFNLSDFVWLRPGSSAIQVTANVGDRVTPQTALATIAVPGSLLAQADVSQLDVGRLKVGQSAQLTFDALNGATATAKVASIPVDPESSQQSVGQNAVVQYAVKLQPIQLPAGARAGMTGQASVVVVQRSNVVIVPTSAIGGSAANPTVQVVSADGRTVTRRVIVGLSTAAGSEIIVGVQPGEQVVTGVAASQSATATTQTNQGGGPGPGFGGVVQ